MPAGSIAAFWGVALLLIAVPGADWAFTLGAGLRTRSALPAVGGLLLGYLGLTLLVAAGLGALVAENPRALTALTVAGGAYLVWVGARTLAAPPPVPVAADETPAASRWAVLAHGVAVSGLNPKGLLIFVALLPQFTDPHRPWPLAIQMGVLGLVFTLTCAVFYLALGSAARGILRTRPAAARAVGRLAGAALVVIGAVLLLDRLTG